MLEPAIFSYMSHPQASAVLLIRTLRLGPMRLTLYGLCAAAGMVSAMSLGGRAGRHAGVNSEAIWDVGLAAIFSCLVTSRLLLILGDPVAFVRFPLLVLGLPSLTIGGMALAALFMLGYLRWKKLPVLGILDSFAPAAALLAAFLELGHALDGSEPGMPLRLHSWRAGSWNPVATASHPVAWYGCVVALLLTPVLWLLLKTLPRGRTAAAGLISGGLIAFLLNMLTQPSALFQDWPLEPGQMVALGAMLVGAVLWTTVRPYAVEDPRLAQSAPSLYPEVR